MIIGFRCVCVCVFCCGVLLWCSLASLSENIGNLFSDGVGCGGGYGSPPVYSFPNKNKNKKKA